jgi:hypothetical protein
VAITTPLPLSGLGKTTPHGSRKQGQPCLHDGRCHAAPGSIHAGVQKVFEKVFTAVLLTAMLSNSTFANPAPEVCSELVKQKQPAAYLIDLPRRTSSRRRRTGQDRARKRRRRRAFQYHDRLSSDRSTACAGGTGAGAGDGLWRQLAPRRSERVSWHEDVCVVLNWVRARGEARPYSFEAALPEFELADKSGYGEDVPSLYRFDARLVGEMVSPGR